MLKPSLPRRLRALRVIRLRLELLEDRCVPATITVNNIGDSATPPAGTVTLRSAILQAQSDLPGDMIVFSPSLSGQTIVLSSVLPTITQNMTITGLGADQLTISGNNKNALFSISSATVSISGLSIIDGNATFGGGLFSSGSATNLTISNSMFANDTAQYGGAVYTRDGTVTLNNDTFSHNTAVVEGGVIDNWAGGKVTVTNDTFTQNSATDGGAIGNEWGSVTVTGCTFNANSAGGTGGALINYNTTDIIAGNTLTVMDSTITGNTADQGGGIGNTTGDTVTLTNVTVSQNSAGSSGGGLFLAATSITPPNTFTLVNTIVAGNTATEIGPDASGSFTSQGNNLIGKTDGSSGWVGSDLTGTTAAPLDPLLGPLANNGGPTQTEVPAATSAAIDHGANAAIPSGTTTDQRGPDFIRIVGASVDIGAVEFQPPATRLAITLSPTSTTYGQTVEFSVTVQPQSPAPNNVPVGSVAFSENLAGQPPTSLGSVDLVDAMATISFTPPSGGTFTLTATYSGDFNFTTNTASASLPVAPEPTKTTLIAAPTRVNVGQSITLTATVTGNPNAPVSGAVTFFNGPNPIGSAPINVNGVATTTFTPATSGPIVFGASFAGNSDFAFSAATAVTVQVETNQGVGVFDPFTATWYLKNSESQGAPDVAPFQYGGSGWAALVGNWTGSGQDTIAVVDPSTNTWYVKFHNTPGAPDIQPFSYGAPGWFPVAGNWTGTGEDGIAVVDLSTATWYIKDNVSAGAPDVTPFHYGEPGWIPVVGDWTGSGHDGIGMFDPSTGTWYLKNSATPGAADTIFQYGMVNGYPVVADWGHTGKDTVAVVDPAANWFIKFSNTSGAPDVKPFQYGETLWTAVGGSWLSSRTGQPLFADHAGPGAPALSNDVLQATVTQALDRLSSSGINPNLLARLASARYEAVALTGDTLGLTFVDSDTVEINTTAAGRSWFTDASAASDAEYVNGQALPNTPASQGIDLLTTVLHEMGHLAGLPDQSPVQAGDGLMNDVLGAGQRRVRDLDQAFMVGI